MKYKFFIALVLICCQQLSSKDIFEDAIERFIENVIEKEELRRKKLNKDSLYNHTLLFEQNVLLSELNIPDSICGYKITKLKPVKEYLDTCSKELVVIFTIDKMVYCESCEAPFSVSFEELFIYKQELYCSLGQWFRWDVQYTYNCKRKKFKYESLATVGDGSISREFLRNRCWTD